jgi:hypothetical protein
MIENGGENLLNMCYIALCRVSGREERWENESGEWKEESGKERRRGEEKYISTVIFFSFFFCKEGKDWMFEGGRNDFQIFSHCLRVVVGVCSGFTWI